MRQVPLNTILEQDMSGKLYLHSMLGRHETWDEMLVELQANDIKKVICLTSFEEVQELSPAYAKAIEEDTLPFEKITIEISDFGIPGDETEFFQHVKDIANALQVSEPILIHCAAGIGRTGMFACCLLQALGLDEDEAVAQIKTVGSGPETKEQRDLVARFR